MSRAVNDTVPAAGSRVLAVVGPTAAGKSDVAHLLAGRLGGEIISADSMQVYRGMDIGTAKPAPSERPVEYHCIDLVDPGEPFSAALFQRCARTAIANACSRGRMPLLVGGTGLYVRAALDDLRFPAGEQVDNAVRQHYEALAAERSPQELHALLASRDPASAQLVHPNNTRRVIRALEMLDSGVSYAEQHEGLADRRSVYDTRFLGMTMTREALYQRIDSRVDEMVRRGLLREVETLLAAGFREALTAQQAIGYKELVPVIEDGAPLEPAVDSIKTASRRYAKRQLTWFRADPRIRWIDVTDLTAEATLEAAMSELDWSHRHEGT